jgi:hypothetical protein
MDSVVETCKNIFRHGDASGGGGGGIYDGWAFEFGSIQPRVMSVMDSRRGHRNINLDRVFSFSCGRDLPYGNGIAVLHQDRVTRVGAVV